MWGISLANILGSAAVLVGSLALEVRAEEEIVFTRGGDLWIMDPEGQSQRPLLQTDVREEAPNCSPDGELIAYQVYDAARRVYDVWVMNQDGTHPRMLVPNGHSPAWSPSCGHLAFVSERGGSHNIWIVDREGQNARPLISTPEQELSPAWSPLGDRLAFIRLNYRKDAEGNRLGCTSRVIIRELTGRMNEVLRQENLELTQVAWSSTGKLLLAGTPYGDPEGGSRLWVATATGGNLRPLPRPPLASDSQPVWAPGGRWLAFVRREGEIQAIWRRSEKGTASRPLTAGDELDGNPTFLRRGASRALRIFIRGRRTYFTPAPCMIGSEVLLPARQVCRALDIQLRWQPQTESLELLKGPHRVRINLRHRAVKRNGQPVRLEPFPRLISGVTMLPLRRLAEWLGIPVRGDLQDRVWFLGEKKE